MNILTIASPPSSQSDFQTSALPLSFVNMIDRYYVSPEVLRVIAALPLQPELIALILSYTFEKKRYGFQKELMDFVSCRVCHARLVIDDSRGIVRHWFFYDCNDYDEPKWQKYWTKPCLEDTRRYVSCVCRHCRPQHDYDAYIIRTSSVMDCSCSLCSDRL